MCSFILPLFQGPTAKKRSKPEILPILPLKEVKPTLDVVVESGPVQYEQKGNIAMLVKLTDTVLNI